MMPLSENVCSRCSSHVPGNLTYCTSCGNLLGDGGGATSLGNFALLRTAAGAPIPLLGVALGGEVFGAHARMVLRQRYKNLESKPIEAVYTFPIPGDATLTGFAMECEGRRMEAEVKEREEAFATYDEAISKGHGAALLEQERPNVFTTNVGNLLPNEETTVEISFLLRLTADEGALRLMIPTLVAPKYIPGAPAGDRTGHGSSGPTTTVPDADRITPKIANVNYGLSLDMVFDLGRDVTIESPSHTIETFNEAGMRKRVTFVRKEVALDRDIILVAEGAAGVMAGIVCDKPSSSEEGTFALTVVPDLFEAKKRSKGRAVVFVVDVSGSMAGASLKQAQRAMLLCLRHLSEGDLFDIIPFSSSFSHFSAGLSGGRTTGADMIPFTQTTLREADGYVDGLRANGGTEMLAPLSAATALLSSLRRDRVIVLLTDGQVGNEAQIVEEISKRSNGTRVYTFGIGTNVSDVLLRDLAKRTKGAVEFIHPGERIDEKVTAQFARATAARVDELTVKWVGVDAGEVAPAEPPALVDGEPWSVYGRYETPGMGRVELRGTLGGEPFYAEIPLELSNFAERPALASLWAGARVRDLESVDASTLGRRAEAHKKRIVDLCVRHRIASKHASFVVVEKRTGDRRSQGMPETRAVPVNAPAGWAMFQGAAQEMDAGLRFKGGSGGMNVNKTTPHMRGSVQMPIAAPLRADPAAEWQGRPGGAPNVVKRMAPPASYSAPAAFAAPPPSAPGFGPPEPRPFAESGGFGPPPAPGGFAPPPAFAPPPPTGASGFGPPPPAFGGRAPQRPAPMAAPAAPPAPQSIRVEVAESNAQQASKEGGVLARAMRALGLGKSTDDAVDTTIANESSRTRAESEAKPSAGKGASTGQAGSPTSDIGGMFAKQLASGLWESGSGDESDQLTSTTNMLVRCAGEGVDSSHAVYGAQVSKAVEALLELAEKLLAQSGFEEALIRALLVMVAVSTGKRMRGRVGAVAQAATSPTIKAVVGDLTSQQAAFNKLT